MLVIRGDCFEKKFIFNFSKGKEFYHCTDTYAGIGRYNGSPVFVWGR